MSYCVARTNKNRAPALAYVRTSSAANVGTIQIRGRAFRRVGSRHLVGCCGRLPVAGSSTPLGRKMSPIYLPRVYDAALTAGSALIIFRAMHFRQDGSTSACSGRTAIKSENEMSGAHRNAIMTMKILTLAVGVAALCGGSIASAQTEPVGGQPPPGRGLLE
jgi:hypothetical protein